MPSALAMTTRLLAGLSDIAPDYDALICDVWGVVHEGHRAHDVACDALRRFRQTRGPVILLTNAPRVPSAVEEQFAGLAVPDDCYDVIISSGGAARAEMARRAKSGTLPFYYLGTGRDTSIFDGLDVEIAPLDAATVMLCTGMRDDDNEVPADYAGELARVQAKGLTMLCANPDVVVERGSELVYCAGALADLYQSIGGDVLYAGKPYAPIYQRALELAASALIMVHNHPSGDPTPSSAGIRMTEELASIGKSLGITVHDHIIVGKNGHSSFRGLNLI